MGAAGETTGNGCDRDFRTITADSKVRYTKRKDERIYEYSTYGTPKNNKRSKASMAIAKAIIDEYYPQNAVTVFSNI